MYSSESGLYTIDLRFQNIPLTKVNIPCLVEEKTDTKILHLNRFHLNSKLIKGRIEVETQKDTNVNEVIIKLFRMYQKIGDESFYNTLTYMTYSLR